MTFHTRFKPPAKVKQLPGGETLTKQEFKDECDINRIMARALRHGVLPQQPGALYGDFSEVGDYQEAQNIILHAQQQFAALPSKVRERFDNDPANMLRFVSDPKNKEEGRKLGLYNPELPAPVKPAPMEVIVIPPEATK